MQQQGRARDSSRDSRGYLPTCFSCFQAEPTSFQGPATQIQNLMQARKGMGVMLIRVTISGNQTQHNLKLKQEATCYVFYFNISTVIKRTPQTKNQYLYVLAEHQQLDDFKLLLIATYAICTACEPVFAQNYLKNCQLQFLQHTDRRRKTTRFSLCPILCLWLHLLRSLFKQQPI